MLYSTIIVSLLFLFNICLSEIVTYNEVGPMEQVTDPSTATNEPAFQEGILRRRLLPGDFTNNEKLIVLNRHNRYRNLTARGLTPNQPAATNMNQLVWDEGLAKVAKNYSSKCIWGHNPNRKTDLNNYLDVTSFDYTNQYVGENLFISTGYESMDTILRGIAYWYDENTYYKYGTVSGTATCQTGQQCGHYTQLVWANTRYVGCSYSKCASVQNLPTFSNAILLTCNYYFAGNYVGQYPYGSGATCSNCPSDRQTCNDGLCDGCPSRSWDKYCCEYCSSTTCSNAIKSGQCNSPSSCSNGISSSTTTSTTTTKSPTNAPPSTTKSPTSAPPTTTKTPTTAAPTIVTTKTPTTAVPTTTTTKSPTTSSPTTTTKSPTTTTKSPTTAAPTTTTTKSPTTASPTTTKSPTTAAPTTTTKSPTTTTKSPTTAAPTTTTTKSPTTASPTTTKSPTTAAPTTTKSPTNAPPTTTKSPTNAPPTTTTTKSPTNVPPTTTKSPTNAPPTTTLAKTFSQEENGGCCVSYGPSYETYCSTLNIDNCSGRQICYWNATC